MLVFLLILVALVGAFLLPASMPHRASFMVAWGCVGGMIAVATLNHNSRTAESDQLAQMMDAALLEVAIFAWLLAVPGQILSALGRRHGWSKSRRAIVLGTGAAVVLLTLFGRLAI